MRLHIVIQVATAWQTVYTVTVETANELLNVCFATWSDKFPDAVAMHREPLGVAQQARWSKEALMQTGLRVQVLPPWLQPLVQAEYGKEGVVTVYRMWQSGALHGDPDLVISGRDKAETYSMCDIQTVRSVHCALTNKAVDIDGTIDTTMEERSLMLDKWSKFKSAYDEETAKFLELVSQDEALRSRSMLRQLVAARRQGEHAEAAVTQWKQTVCCIVHPGDLMRAKLVHGDFMQRVCADANLPQHVPLPTFHIWNMNTGGARIESDSHWKPVSDGLKNLIQSQPNHNLAAVVLKKTTSSRVSKDTLLYQILTHMEKSGLNVATDLTLQYKRGHGSNRRSRAFAATCLGCTESIIKQFPFLMYWLTVSGITCLHGYFVPRACVCCANDDVRPCASPLEPSLFPLLPTTACAFPPLPFHPCLSYLRPPRHCSSSLLKFPASLPMD